MARALSPAVQAILDSGEAIEPVMVIAISYGPGLSFLYADRDIGDLLNPAVHGKILTFGNLESTVRTDGGGQSTSISFVLDDSDGMIKTIMDNVDISNARVIIQQYFEGITSLSDLVNLFYGVLATPIEWDEGTRSVTFTAVTDHATLDAGFSLNEANVSVYHQDLANKAWPMVFGNPRYIPILALQEYPVGTIVNTFSTPKWVAPNQGSGALDGAQPAASGGGGGGLIEDKLTPSEAAALDLEKERNNFYAEHADDPWFDYTDQETKFLEREAEIDRMRRDEQWPEATSAAPSMDPIANFYYLHPGQPLPPSLGGVESPGQNTSAPNITTQLTARYYPFLRGNLIVGGYRFPQGVPLICKINEQLFKITFLGGKHIPANPEDACPVHVEQFHPQLQFIWGQFNSDKGGGLHAAGSKVEVVGPFPGGFKHVVSIVPGAVQNVYAYRKFNGRHELVKVPTHLYTIKHQVVNSQIVFTYITLKRQLSTMSFYENFSQVTADNVIKRFNSGLAQPFISRFAFEVDWEDDLYVDFQSAIGPNICDIITWLVLNFTPLTIDVTSFNYVHAKVANYPADFALFESKAVDQLVSDIAYQSRCAVWTNNGKYYIKYLPDDAHVTNIVTRDDILYQSLKVVASSSDDLVTKYIATWRPDYIHPQNEVILRNNVGRYGVREESHDFYIYNHVGLVEKSATFWLIRKSFLWKMVTCEVLLNKVGIETLDDITLDLGNTMVTTTGGGVACQVESAQYDTDKNTITLNLWTGIRFGEMTVYPFARPANVSDKLVFPLFTDVQLSAPLAINLTGLPLSTPAFNNIQNNLGGDSSTGAQQNGYKEKDRPATQGDKTPSDTGNNYVKPAANTTPDYLPVEMPALAEIQKAADPVGAGSQSIPPQSPKIASKQDLKDWKPKKGFKKNRAVPGKVISGGGKTWQIDAYPQGIGHDPVSVTATENHNCSDLTDIEGEWVTVYRHIDKQNNPIYTFKSQHWASMPVRMQSKTSGFVYPEGSQGTNSGRQVNQIQIAGSFDIPPDTWGICVRTFNGGTVQFEVQIPVWLPEL